MSVTITWDQDALDSMRQAGAELTDEYALRVAAAAEPPVDTGFLRASAYVHSDRQSTFDAVWPSDYYESAKQGRLVARERVDAPEEPPDEFSAVAGWAAIYAWEVEDTQPFIYPALLKVAEESEGELTILSHLTPRDDYIDRNNPRFVSPEGPVSGPPPDTYIDRNNPRFVAP